MARTTRTVPEWARKLAKAGLLAEARPGVAGDPARRRVLRGFDRHSNPCLEPGFDEMRSRPGEVWGGGRKPWAKRAHARLVRRRLRDELRQGPGAPRAADHASEGSET